MEDIELYTFYYDETFHDRKIKIDSEGNMHALNKDNVENYIGVFWGCKQEDIIINKKILEKFEENEKKRYGLSESQELKSDIIGKKNYTYGIRSFNKNAMSFYDDLFTTLEIINPALNMIAISKVEIFLISILKKLNVFNEMKISTNAFFYSLTKFIVMYSNKELLGSLYGVKDKDSALSFMNELISYLHLIINADEGIIRKDREVTNFRQMVLVLEYAEIEIREKKEISFPYYIIPEALILLLHEKKISERNVDVVIDREKNTYLSIKKYNFNDVREVDSKKNIQVRFSDLLCGFISRIMYSIVKDTIKNENVIEDKNDIIKMERAKKRLLDKKWFQLNEKQYNLYKKIHRVLIVNNKEYWASFALDYADGLILFFSLFNYISSYDSYSEFKELESGHHIELFNTYACMALEEHYKNFTEV